MSKRKNCSNIDAIEKIINKTITKFECVNPRYIAEALDSAGYSIPIIDEQDVAIHSKVEGDKVVTNACRELAQTIFDYFNDHSILDDSEPGFHLRTINANLFYKFLQQFGVTLDL